MKRLERIDYDYLNAVEGSAKGNEEVGERMRTRERERRWWGPKKENLERERKATRKHERLFQHRVPASRKRRGVIGRKDERHREFSRVDEELLVCLFIAVPNSFSFFLSCAAPCPPPTLSFITIFRMQNRRK